MTLLDGTEVKAGDFVKAKIVRNWRRCKVLELLRAGVEKAVLAAPSGHTIIRSRYQIRRDEP